VKRRKTELKEDEPQRFVMRGDKGEKSMISKKTKDRVEGLQPNVSSNLKT